MFVFYFIPRKHFDLIIPSISLRFLLKLYLAYYNFVFTLRKQRAYLSRLVRVVKV